jgi:lipopolysaccharide export system protein LptA
MKLFLGCMGGLWLSVAGVMASTGDVEITADILECNPKEKICEAEGHAKVVKGVGVDAKTLTAQKIKAYMEQTSSTDQKLKVSRVEAVGSVILVSASGEKVSANRANYDVATHKAHFYENVVVTQGATIMKGKKGTADLNAGTFRLDEGVRGSISSGKGSK